MSEVSGSSTHAKLLVVLLKGVPNIDDLKSEKTFWLSVAEIVKSNVTFTFLLLLPCMGSNAEEKIGE